MQITFVFCVRRYSRPMRCIKDSTDSGAPNKTTVSMSPISIPISKVLVETQMAQAVAPNQTSTSSHCSFVQRRVMRPNRSMQTLPRLQGSGQLHRLAAEICKHQQQIPLRYLFHQAFRKHRRFSCSWPRPNAIIQRTSSGKFEQDRLHILFEKRNVCMSSNLSMVDKRSTAWIGLFTRLCKRWNKIAFKPLKQECFCIIKMPNDSGIVKMQWAGWSRAGRPSAVPNVASHR